MPRPVPALHRAGVRGRHDRPLAAVAEGAAERRRAAPDQQRRRHHQLRDAAHRSAAARLRPRPRGRRAPDRTRAPATASRCRRSTGRRARSTHDMVVIDDADGPTSIAGLMGGARSEVQPARRAVLLEVASWNGPNIHRTSWALGLRSEASGALREGPSAGAVHARTGGRSAADGRALRSDPRSRDDRRGWRAGDGWVPPPSRSLRLRERRVRAILGVRVARERQAEILERARLLPPLTPTTASRSRCRRCAATTSRARST